VKAVDLKTLQSLDLSAKMLDELGSFNACAVLEEADLGCDCTESLYTLLMLSAARIDLASFDTLRV